MCALSVHKNTGEVLPGEGGGDGKVVYSRRGRVVLRGAQIEEGQALFPSRTGLSVRPEGSFKSNGSSNDSMAAAVCSWRREKHLNYQYLFVIECYILNPAW